MIGSKGVLIICLLIVGFSCRKPDQEIPPVADFAFEPDFGLTTDTLILKASSTKSGSANLSAYFRWDWNNDGIWDTEYEKHSISKHRFYAPGKYQTILQVINSNGLTDTFSQEVQIDQGYSPPHPKFEVYPPFGNFLTEFIFDASVSFDDEDSLDQLVFRWDWDGNGIWDTHFKPEPIVTHIFRDMDFYNVALQVQDPGKLIAQTMKTVEVNNLNPKLIPNFTWTPEYGTTADTFLLDASSTYYRDEPFTTLLYSWKIPPDFGWTKWDTCSSITAKFYREVDYYIEMQVRDTNNLIGITKKKITIYHENLPPKPVLELGCKRGNIRTQFYFDSWMTRDLESLPTSLQVRWDFDGDGNFDTEYSKERRVYHQYPEAGTYQIILEAMDPEGLSDTTSQYVIVSPYTNETGLIRDHRDQQIYGTVKIGNQWWMSENLNFSPWDSNKDYVEKWCYKRWDGDPVPWCNYVGGLYSIFHATRNDFYNDVKGICPKNWHMPSKAEWEELIEEIGGLNQADRLVIGGDTDFNALYAGHAKWVNSQFRCEGLEDITYFWSFKRLAGWPIAQSCWNIALLKNESKIYAGYSGNDSFFSVRCIRDDE